jgi:hypothetical protein
MPWIRKGELIGHVDEREGEELGGKWVMNLDTICIITAGKANR